jgi:signal transduction histidine kinase/ligand-binding sensor domain-containing protein
MTSAKCLDAILKIVTRFFRVVGLVLLTTSMSAQALTRERSLQQLRHTSWGAKEGAPPGSISAIAQTRDGYLWVSDFTLWRFDGVKFEPVDLPRDPRLSSMRITRLFASGSGGLWIGFDGAAGLLKDGQLKVYTRADGFPSGSVSGFAEEDDGTVWAATTGALVRLAGAQWEKIGPDWNYPVAQKPGRSLMVDSVGTVWESTSGRVLFLPKGQRKFQELKVPIKGGAELAESATGAVWLEDESGLRFIRRISNGTGRAASSSRGPLFDRDGALWTLGSFTLGVYRIPHPELFEDGRTVVEKDVPEAFTEKDGLSANRGSTLFEDREGNVWSGMASGLNRFANPSLIRAVMPPLPKGQDFAAPSAALAAADNGALWIIDSVRPLLHFQDGKVEVNAEVSALNSTIRASDGSVWFAGPGKLWNFKAGQFTKTDLPPGTEGFQVQSIAEGKSGAMWVSIQYHGLFEFADGRWTAQPVLPSAPKSSGIAMTSDRDGGIWAAFTDNRIAALGDGGWHVYTRQDGIQVGNVTALFARGAQIWAGGEYGLARFDKAQFQTLLPTRDHLFDGITGIVETKSGELWLNGRAGIVRISADEINRSVADPLHRVRAEVFGVLDGLQGTSQRIRPLPTAIEGTDGRLWFSTSAGFYSIDPGQIARNPVPPLLKIESLDIDGKPYPPAAALTLPKRSQAVRIGYVGLSLTMAEKVRYRYKLDGVDTTWQEADTRREALYTNLKPGRYTFHVTAANNDGVWNEQGTTMDLVLPPAFVQTGWFIAACIVGGLVLMGLLVRFRVRQISDRMRSRVDARLAERERIARELHDTLLQSTQGLIIKFQAVASDIPCGDPARKRIEQALELADEVMVEGRERVMDLRAPAHMWGDLARALATAGDELARDSAITFHISTEGAPRELDPRVREEIYAMGREALLNAFRHAHAKLIAVQIDYGKRALQVSIRDDGIGIEDAILRAGGRVGHWGLKGMGERATSIRGTLLAERQPEGGTHIQIKVPARWAYRPSSLSSALLSLVHVVNRLTGPARRRPGAEPDVHRGGSTADA